jgi:hypothetical protein
MRTGTLNNYVQWSKSWGGVRKCYEAKPTLLVGGFDMKLEDMPAYPNVLPAGSPVRVDETAGVRSIVPLYTFKVVAVDAAEKKITVEKYETGSVAKVGMKLIVIGDDLSEAAANVATVSEVDASASDKDVITLDAVTGISEGAVLGEAGDDSKLKVVPNALTYCDNQIADRDAYAMDVDACWNCIDKPVLERRMPPITDSIKAALREAGCFFRFSNRK